MSTTTYHLPQHHLAPRRVTTRVSDTLETIRTAPTPMWGVSTADHGRYLSYLVGSIVIWTVLPLLVTGVFAALLSL